MIPTRRKAAATRARTALVAAALAAGLGGGFGAAPARAAFIVTMTQSGADVVASGSGSFNLAAASLLFTTPLAGPAMTPNGPAILLGAPGSPSTNYFSVTMSGPASFGTGASIAGSSGTGSRVGIENSGFMDLLALPVGYTSGDAIAGTMSFANASYTSLGVTPGSYVWSWGEGASADSFTLNITAVPEPATLALLGPLVAGWGLLGLGAARRRRAENQARRRR